MSGGRVSRNHSPSHAGEGLANECVFLKDGFFEWADRSKPFFEAQRRQQRLADSRKRTLAQSVIELRSRANSIGPSP